MAQSTEKNYAGTPDDQDRRASRRDRDEAKRMLDGMDEKKKSSTAATLDSIKKRYFTRLLGDKGIKVKSPKVSSVEETSLGKITTIPKIVQRNMNEIEIQPILKNFSYVRILYDTMANEYFYEAIEPKLIEEESEILDVLKEILVENLEMLDDADRARKENYLRRIVDGLLRELGVELHPVSKERVLYYVYRDFIRYGPIDVVMTDIQVEDVSCDGVRVPLYIYHRKYGSIPSNLKFDNAEELDSFVVWLAQRSGKHISVAQPMLDATIPDGSRLQATLGMHVTKRGSSFTIRRFRENPFTPLDLVRFKTMSPEMMASMALNRERAVDAHLRRHCLREDHDAERDPPVHPAPDEDRVHRGHAGTEPAPRELGPAPHPRRVRRPGRFHGEARRRDRHVRPSHGGPPSAPPVHDDRRSPWTRGVRRVPGHGHRQVRVHDVPRG